MKPWRSKGSQNLHDWEIGERVKYLREIKPGDILLQDTERVDAHNLCRVLRKDEARGVCYAIFVDPADPARVRMPGDTEFAIWDYELRIATESHYRVNRTVPARA